MLDNRLGQSDAASAQHVLAAPLARPNRQERRREAAKVKRHAPRQCACCAPLSPKED
jgi:hypothetical protein